MYTVSIYRGLGGVHRFSLQYLSMEEGCKNYKETLYSSKGHIVIVVGNPCNIYPMISFVIKQ